MRSLLKLGWAVDNIILISHILNLGSVIFPTSNCCSPHFVDGIHEMFDQFVIWSMLSWISQDCDPFAYFAGMMLVFSFFPITSRINFGTPYIFCILSTFNNIRLTCLGQTRTQWLLSRAQSVGGCFGRASIEPALVSLHS